MGARTPEQVTQRDVGEICRGADDRFTTPKGEDFIPGRLVMTAPALTPLASSNMRDPSCISNHGLGLTASLEEFLNTENAPCFVGTDEPDMSMRNVTSLSVVRTQGIG